MALCFGEAGPGPSKEMLGRSREALFVPEFKLITGPSWDRTHTSFVTTDLLQMVLLLTP